MPYAGNVLNTFLLIWISCLAGGLCLWAVSVARRDVSIVDIFWGPGFLLAALLAWWRGGQTSGWHLLLLAMTAAWALRLAVHIARRSRGHGEDRRYAAMREKHGDRFRWISLFTVFLLQGTLATLLSAPLVLVQLQPVVRPIWCIVGSVLWFMGLLFESVADAQLLAFQRDPGSRGKVLDSGLWRYSRHPNYFGEALLWWGFGLFALGVPNGFWTLYAPAVTTLLLLRVSGVPLLEKGIEKRRPGYREYVERTSSFIPWPPRGRRGEP